MHLYVCSVALFVGNRHLDFTAENFRADARALRRACQAR
jgi:hypothetical protein